MGSHLIPLVPSSSLASSDETQRHIFQPGLLLLLLLPVGSAPRCLGGRCVVVSGGRRVLEEEPFTKAHLDTFSFVLLPSFGASFTSNIPGLAACWLESEEQRPSIMRGAALLLFFSRAEAGLFPRRQQSFDRSPAKLRS